MIHLSYVRQKIQLCPRLFPKIPQPSHQKEITHMSRTKYQIIRQSMLTVALSKSIQNKSRLYFYFYVPFLMHPFIVNSNYSKKLWASLSSIGNVSYPNFDAPDRDAHLNSRKRDKRWRDIHGSNPRGKFFIFPTGEKREQSTRFKALFSQRRIKPIFKFVSFFSKNIFSFFSRSALYFLPYRTHGGTLSRFESTGIRTPFPWRFGA